MGDEMKLGELFPDVSERHATQDVSGISADSREVKRGSVFFALSGTKQNGDTYIDAAIAAGAVAVVSETESSPAISDHVCRIITSNARQLLAETAAKFYPLQPQTIVAVTGTAGKSSVADFTRQIFTRDGHEAASLGTIGIVRTSSSEYGSLTTPDPVKLHQTLDRLAHEGVTHLALEASSHGLDQFRLDGVRLKAAAFTNLGHDHLDYHATREAYLAAKLGLFDRVLPKDGVVVVNADAPESAAVIDIAKRRGMACLTVGLSGSDMRLIGAVDEGFDQVLSVEWRGNRHSIRLPLAGRFQASNALVAATLALAIGEAEETVFDALHHLQGVKGRLERVGLLRGGLILVDYAHKPDALEQVLKTLRPMTRGKLICVFGCGGDRDQAKRPLMGEIAARLADHVIVTDDNPRSENPAAIRQSILARCPGASDIGDRFEAIKAGMAMVSSGDVMVIAGKGHETGQIVGETVLPFSDHDAVATLLAEMNA
jgi:UDP-N-acetylmuramoyl-L-alanyl-D-glutamate--2,6-diaminopimelate ligase